MQTLESALQENERRFRAFVSATSDVVYQVSADWSELRQLQGRSFIPDTSDPSRTWLDKYIHPEDQELVVRTFREAIRKKEIYQLEHRVFRVDGSLGWAYSRAIPFFDEHGEITEWFGAATDVTARRTAEEKMQAQLARLSLLGSIARAIGERQDVQSIFQVVIRTLEQQLPVDFAVICLHEPAANHLTVTSVGAKSAARAAELALPERAQVPIGTNGLARCMEGQLVYEPDVSHSHSHSPLPQKLACAGLRSLVIAPLTVQNEVFGVLIAARRDADAFSSVDCEFLLQVCEHLSLATRQAQLHASLQEAYEDLRESQESVMQQERLRALGQLASGIAHDINNALTPALLYTQAVLEQESALSAEGRQRLEIVNRAIEDVGVTVARMRTFHRARDAELTLTPLNLNELLRQVTELTRARWRDIPQEQGVLIELRSEFDPSLPLILGAESEIRDALTNLVINAVDAMPGGGTLTLRSSLRGARVVIEIGDTGVGMSDAIRTRCLEPFFTTKGERGSGLGLAMVYGMTQRHNADLEIDSEPGRGTVMRLCFHVANVQGDETASAESGSTAPLRLLLVDDDPVLLQSLRDVLAFDGHEVSAADGGQRGIDEFFAARNRDAPFDLVVTDLGMPKVDGRTVAAAIKSASPDTPVILLTGWGKRLQDESRLPDHVDCVLSKPPRISELRATLARLAPRGKQG